MGISTANVDAGGDSPRSARTDILAAIQALNSGLPIDPTASFLAGTLAGIQQDSGVVGSAYAIDTLRNQVKANGTSGDLTPTLTQAKTLNGNRPIKLMPGTWSISSFSFVGWLGGFKGERSDTTVLKASATPSVFLNAYETSDALGVTSAIDLSDLFIEGLATAGTALRMRYRHHSVLRNLYIAGFATGIEETDTYVNRSENVRITACNTGWHLVGSNHNSQHRSAVITGCSYMHLLIESNGTAADGNEGIKFDGIEISDGTGNGIDDTGSSVSFQCCYIGENIGGIVYTKRGTGITLFEGGSFWFGYTTGAVAFQVLGGSTIVRAVKINGQTDASLGGLTAGSGGKIKFEDCQFNFPVGGDVVLEGDPLGFGKAYECFAAKAPRQYTCTPNNCTVSTTDTGNVRTFACTAISGSGSHSMWITGSLTNSLAWINGVAYLVIVYRSTIAFNVRLSGGAGGAVVTKLLGTLPATAGNLRTYVKLDAVLDTAAYTVLEIYSDSVVGGNSIELDWVNLSDGTRMPLGNLWKC